jgi:hypothetical protein
MAVELAVTDFYKRENAEEGTTGGAPDFCLPGPARSRLP